MGGTGVTLWWGLEVIGVGLGKTENWLVNSLVQCIQDQPIIDLCLAWSGVVFLKGYIDHRVAKSLAAWDRLRCDLVVNAHALYTSQPQAWQVT